MATPVHATTASGVTTLTLDSPANRNALSAGLVAALREALASAAADGPARAVVLTHTGSTFCSGADLKSPCDPADFLALLAEIAGLSKPVVARVTGHVRAGGLGLLGVCDIAAAGPKSSYAFTETHLGVVPAVISAPLLPRLDPRAAARYFLTAEAFDAAERPDRPAHPARGRRRRGPRPRARGPAQGRSGGAGRDEAPGERPGAGRARAGRFRADGAVRATLRLRRGP